MTFGDPREPDGDGTRRLPRVGDYWKLGTAELAWYFIVSVFIVPQIWSL